MLYNAKTILKKIQNHIAANKGAYVMGAVAVAAIALEQCNRVAFDKFLISEGIDPQKYYCPEDYTEKIAE